MTNHTDILIIGGGISGLLTARELLLAGRRVTIIDKSTAGRESSWAGGGILLPIYPWRQSPAISTLVLDSLPKYPLLNQQLLEATGIDPEWRDCGMLICKNPDYYAAINWCMEHNIPYEAALTEQLAQLNTSLEHPLWLPSIAQIRNPRLLQSLKAFLLHGGVKILENTEITGIDVQQQRITKVITTEQSFSADEFILCTGAWTADWLKERLAAIHTELPIQPIKGQMLVFTALPDTLPHMILDGDEYLIPRRDGRILAGSTVEATGFDKTITSLAKQRLYDFATNLLPTLKKFPLSHHWAGLRPGTPQGIPYIGRHPNFENLSINAGHFRNGLVMGPASAALLADLLLGRPTAVDPKPYALK